ncbi:MAG TPA: hypothetical protein VLF91_02680 [Candidatus Saccharimonadales bacterium]|nr:hypothetical protein [Candidatus Saccharimonadales bacterium]
MTDRPTQPAACAETGTEASKVKTWHDVRFGVEFLLAGMLALVLAFGQIQRLAIGWQITLGVMGLALAGIAALDRDRSRHTMDAGERVLNIAFMIIGVISALLAIWTISH